MGSTVMSIPTRACGPARLTIPAMAIGSWHTWDRAVMEEVVQIIRRAIDVGVRMFDVGVYRAGWDGEPYDSPTDIVFARAMQLSGIRRSEYLLSAKGWIEPTSQSLVAQVDELLYRQGTDYADFLIVGGIVDQDTFQVESMVAQIAEALRSGKIRYWGLNNWPAARVREAQACATRQGIDAPQLAQLHYGLCHRTIGEGEPYTTLCEETGLSLQASHIFDGGLILGKGKGWRKVMVDVGRAHASIAAAQDRLREVAAGFGMTTAQFAFAYPLTNPRTANVLVGLRTMEQFEELLAAYPLLERVDIAEFRAAAEEFWFDRGHISPDAGGEDHSLGVSQ